MYGREGDLIRLNNDRNNPALSKFERYMADKAHATIVKQIKDKPLMRLRSRLIGAVKAGDHTNIDKIEKLMRSHTGEDKETGL